MNQPPYYKRIGGGFRFPNPKIMMLPWFFGKWFFIEGFLILVKELMLLTNMGQWFKGFGWHEITHTHTHTYIYIYCKQ
jgi:hypothetical protein